MKKLITPYADDFGKPNIVIKHFPDTESYVLIPQLDSLKNKKIMVYHRLYPEPEKRLFRLMLLLSRVKEKTKEIELFIPYLPYARQDRENKKGEALSADVLCGILKSCGVKKLITYDCHFLPQVGRFTRNGLSIENKSAGKELVAFAKKYYGKNKFCIISPDQGSSYFIENAKGHASHSLQKTRGESKADGTLNGIHADISGMTGHVDLGNSIKGQNICILDDIIASGNTIIHAIQHLKKLGAKRIIVGATHGVFADDKIAEKILKSGASKIFVTSSIPQKNSLLGILSIKQSI